MPLRRLSNVLATPGAPFLPPPLLRFSLHFSRTMMVSTQMKSVKNFPVGYLQKTVFSTPIPTSKKQRFVFDFLLNMIDNNLSTRTLKVYSVEPLS
jgi:hypothetical protein